MKLLRIAALALLVTTSAFAQDDDPIQVPVEKAAPAPPAAQASPPQQPAPAKFYLEVDQNDLAVLGAGLNELPKKIADPVVLKLNGQLSPPAQAQITANKDAAEKAKKAKK